MNENCEHFSNEKVGMISEKDLQHCVECKSVLVSNEIEIIGMFYEVGGFCDNPKCIRYLLLTV